MTRTEIPNANDGAPHAGSSPVVRTETRFRHSDGHNLWGRMTATRIPDPRERPYPETGQEVAARKWAEDETRQSPTRFRALFEATTAGIVEVAPDGRILMANGSFCLMIGYTSAELIRLTVADMLFPEDRTSVLAQFHEVVAGRLAEYEADRRYRRKDGSILWARVSVRVWDEIAKPSGATAVAIDLTDRKHLEERLQRVQKEEAVGLQASGLIHDFNNLLTVIAGCAGILLERVPNAGSTRDLVLEINAACRRAAGLTTQLLTVGRPTPVATKVLDLNEVVAQSIRLLHCLLGPGIALVVDLTDAPSAVNADPAQLEQVILNLAINAKDAMPRGGTLTIETHGIRVRGEDRGAYPDIPPGEYVQLAVCDTGAGMTEEVKSRAFEPFFTTKGVGKGNGLGLASVHGTVAQCGGRVAVGSELGVGTIVEILLPTLATGPVPTSEGVRLLPQCAATVLLVEPEGATRKLARLALRSHGYTVLEAQDGVAALQLAREHTGSIQLLLMGVGGRELADALRVRHSNIEILSLLESAEATSRPGTSENPNPFIPEPFTPLSLVHKVRAVLAGSM